MRAPVVGFVVRMFPLLSETFVANDILALERLGVRARIFSYRAASSPAPHAYLSQLQSPVTYLPDPLNRHVGPLVRAGAATYRREPARYRRAFRYVLRHTLAERNLDTWRRFLQAAYLADLLASTDIEHLHAHFARGATRITMLTSMLSGLPYSFTAHARDVYVTDHKLLREKIAGAEFVIACAGANQRYLQHLVGPEQQGKIKLAYHGVDLDTFRAGEPTATAGPATVLAVGRLVPKKGLRYLVEAIAALQSRGFDLRCVIVGEGPERAPLERLIETLGLRDVVRLAGARSREELIEIYQQATVFALPCTVLEDGDRDGVPNVLLEAMAVGLPVVSCAVAGVPELVESGDNGLLVAERNTIELAAAIELLLNDRGLRSRLGAQGRRTVAARFDSVTTGEAVLELLVAAHAAQAGRPGG